MVPSRRTVQLLCRIPVYISITYVYRHFLMEDYNIAVLCLQTIRHSFFLQKNVFSMASDACSMFPSIKWHSLDLAVRHI